MLRIPCPSCGSRDHTEFSYGGDASTDRPDTSQPVDDLRWIDYLYLRRDPAGEHCEFWHHSRGCRSWLRVRRDTITNAILDVVQARPTTGAP